MEPGRPPVSTPGFWDELYAAGNDGWELGMPAPALTAWLETGGRFTAEEERPARVAVPGSGRGHDARLLARAGCEVWGFDFASAAIDRARALARQEGVPITYEERDIFTLGGQYSGFFDGVREYTCFCAIDPARREEYARLIHGILRPRGLPLGCFYPLREGTDGPPFAVSVAEIERVLRPYFRLLESGPPAVSVERRRGIEWLVVAERAWPRCARIGVDGHEPPVIRWRRSRPRARQEQSERRPRPGRRSPPSEATESKEAKP